MGQCQTKDDEPRPPDGSQWKQQGLISSNGEKSPLLRNNNNKKVTSDTTARSDGADYQDSTLEELGQMEDMCMLYQRIIDSAFLGADQVACRKKGAGGGGST
mmetsp:Transcript_9419/g.13988  ORF Transcript_9419/g.13988 Transcript_9419/m.13988 type:complete len:102 (-) Transcript_9419:3-308(-)